MNNINNVTLQGRLVRDPNVRTGNGATLAFCVLAVNHRYRDKANVPQDEAAFVPFKLFGKWTEELAGRRKGDMALVTGRLRTETWGEGEAQQSKLVLICDFIQFVAPMRSEPRSQVPGAATSGDGETLGAKGGADSKMPPF